MVERLRAPGGCPWDREQTHRTLRPYLLEETYEALEAIEGGQPARLREELGDLLLQVLMHCAIAQESAEGFDVGDVAEVTRQKMVHRHPHVFGSTEVAGAAEVVVNWEKLKAAEKGERLSVLEGVPITLPALAYALGVQKRPARLGFDETPALAAVLTRLHEAVSGLETETAADERIRFDEDVRCRHERRLAGAQIRERTCRARMAFVSRVEQGQQSGRVDKDRDQSNASSR